MNRTRQSIAIILLILLFGSIVSGIIIIRPSTEENNGGTARIYGTLYDLSSEKGINNELAVSLRDSIEWDVRWPDDADRPGYYEFVDVEPGRYSLFISRSWAKHSVLDPDWQYIQGGWIYPETESLTVKAGDEINRDFYLDFYAFFSDSTSFDNLRIRGETSEIYRYVDSSILMDDRNLIGKVMDFSVSWENSFLTRIDCNIEVFDQYSSSEGQFESGIHTESLSFTIEEDFVSESRERERFYWEIIVQSLPSVEIQDIEIQINWTISNQ